MRAANQLVLTFPKLLCRLDAACFKESLLFDMRVVSLQSMQRTAEADFSVNQVLQKCQASNSDN